MNNSVKRGALLCTKLLSRSGPFARRMLTVTPIPALGDNYMYLIVDDETKAAALVDPVEPDKIMAESIKAACDVKAVLTTHHHWDHAGGNEKLVQDHLPNVTVYGGDERIGALTKQVTHDDRFKIGNLDVRCLFTPCHTSGHICYFVTDTKGNKAVFTGDTLFIAGCGRFFEGSPAEMDKALNGTLGLLPDDTKVYVGHEYTVKNLEFAKSVDAENPNVTRKLEWAKDRRSKGEYTVPSDIAQEKSYNPFMRVRETALKQLAKTEDPIEVMRVLRGKKDKF